MTGLCGTCKHRGTYQGQKVCERIDVSDFGPPDDEPTYITAADAWDVHLVTSDAFGCVLHEERGGE